MQYDFFLIILFMLDHFLSFFNRDFDITIQSTNQPICSKNFLRLPYEKRLLYIIQIISSNMDSVEAYLLFRVLAIALIVLSTVEMIVNGFLVMSVVRTCNLAVIFGTYWVIIYRKNKVALRKKQYLSPTVKTTEPEDKKIFHVTKPDVLFHKFCLNCGSPITFKDRFCTHCGKQI